MGKAWPNKKIYFSTSLSNKYYLYIFADSPAERQVARFRILMKNHFADFRLNYLEKKKLIIYYLFKRGPELREWLVSKLINAETAAYKESRRKNKLSVRSPMGVQL